MTTTRGDTRLAALGLVAAGAFLGATLRYGIDAAVGSALPFGTLAANVLGSFVLGALLSEGSFAAGTSRETRLLVGTGFCSSLTTYSTFAAETAALAPAMAGGYVLGTYALGFAAILAGGGLARWTG